MSSAAVYLTLGALTMRVADGRVDQVLCMATAMLVTFLVGASRVFLGVHYPTDVLAGWMMGLTWALACWAWNGVSSSAPGSAAKSRSTRPRDARTTAKP